MNKEDFEDIFDYMVDRSRKVLVEKAKEYADDRDRLRNFKIAGALQEETAREALAGMMAKHTVSVYDICKADTPPSLEVVDEKITDHINYLLLLRALVTEDISTISEISKHA